MRFARVTQVVLALFCFSACNPYSIIDTPAGDVQILAAARACFDAGDYTCASKYYGKLSSASSDFANSEGAFQVLAQNGVTVAVFMGAVLAGSTSGGKLVTKLANSLTSVASSTTRLNIFHAYQKTTLINDSRVRGLIRFITALSLMAEILAEDAGTAGKIQQKDFVSDVKTCLADPTFSSSSCNKPSGKKITSGSAPSSLTTATDSEMSGTPSLKMIYAALTEVNAGITEMKATGSLGSSSSSFASSVLAATINSANDSPIFRGTLVKQGVGEE